MHFSRLLAFVAALHVCTALGQTDAARQPRTLKKLAGEYTLVKGRANDAHIYVCAAHEDTCVSAHKIGWQQPFIVIRDEGAEPGWSVIDTRSHKETQIDERSGLPAELKDIRLYPVAVAWQKLSFTRALW